MWSAQLAHQDSPGGVILHRIPLPRHPIRAINGLVLTARLWPVLKCPSMAGFQVPTEDVVGIDGVVGAGAAIPDIRSGARKECLSVNDPLGSRHPWLGFGVVVLGQAFNLLDVKGPCSPS